MDRLLSPVRRHPWRALSVATLVVLAGGAFLARDVIRLTLAPEAPIDATLPVVPALSPAPDEVVYRVDASRSELHVGVDEVLAGAERRVELTTKAIARRSGLSHEAIDCRFRRLNAKLGAASRTDAARIAAQYGLL